MSSIMASSIEDDQALEMRRDQGTNNIRATIENNKE